MTRTFRWVLWPILVIGIVLIVAPFAISLPSKATAGQKMIDNFHPIMQPAAVKTTVAYYDKTFMALGPVATGGVAASGEIPALFAGLAGSLHMTQPQLVQFLQTKFPALAQLLERFPQLAPVFKRVPPGLAWYKPLVTTMRDNVTNYAKIDSLPNFNLFTWFFVVPGILVVILAGLGLIGLYRPRRLQVSETETPPSVGEKKAV